MTPILYILMRTDLPSMNAGKAMAQASHASNTFIHEAKKRFKTQVENQLEQVHLELEEAKVAAWEAETQQGFGTVLVLGATSEEIYKVMEVAATNCIHTAGLVYDPTYPYRVENGEIARLISPTFDTIARPEVIDPKAPVTLYRHEMTCAYLFGDKEQVGGFVSHLKLHP